MGKALRVLIVEDSEDDALLLVRELQRNDYEVEWERVETGEAMAAALENQAWDIIIADYALPYFSGLEALKLLQQSGLDLPFIIVSGKIGEDVAVEAMKAGAHDYLMKGNLARLAPAVERELREAEVRRERKRAEEALRWSNRHLEQALTELQRTQQQVIQQERLHALGQMASGVAHDFNNALSPILGFSDLLLTRPEALEDRQTVTRYLRMINMAAQDGAAVVTRMREFYRNRDESETFTPVNIDELVGEAILLTQPSWKEEAQAKGVGISVETDLQGVPPLSGSQSQLREVLTNLILNAVGAMPEGGTITIRTRRDDGHVVLELSDTGTGMSEEVRERCLEPFFSTKGAEGTGMGLAMVYGIVQRHEGTIEIESEVGKGTTVIIRLPLQAHPSNETDGAEARVRPTRSLPVLERAPGMTGDSSASLKPARLVHVLVVEDEPIVRKLVTEYLTGDGHTIEIATNGREGLEKFREGAFDLVLTDRAMPEKSGDWLAAAIKEEAPNTPVIMLTGFGDIMKATEESSPGVDLILAKPLMLKELRQALAKVMAE